MAEKYDITRDYYRILGVARTANRNEVRRAYYLLARKFHPDKTGGDLKKAEKFKIVLEAYEVLTDPFVRRSYDDARKFFSTGYNTPSDDDVNVEQPSKSKQRKKESSGRKSKSKAKSSTPPKTPKSDESKAESNVPPEFRERARASYSYTYSSPNSSNDQPKPEPKPEHEPEPEEYFSQEYFNEKEPCKNFYFRHYYYQDFTERPFLAGVRLAKLHTLRAWRMMQIQSEEARFKVDYSHPGDDLEALSDMLKDRKQQEKQLCVDKASAELRCNEHERRAKMVLEQEKKERAAKGKRGGH